MKKDSAGGQGGKPVGRKARICAMACIAPEARGQKHYGSMRPSSKRCSRSGRRGTTVCKVGSNVRWRCTILAAKGAIEIRQIVETDVICDVTDRALRVKRTCQETIGACEALRQQEFRVA